MAQTRIINGERFWWSPSRAAFYPASMHRSYHAGADGWPDDARMVSHDVFVAFGLTPAPYGQKRGADADGNPCWVTLEPAP